MITNIVIAGATAPAKAYLIPIDIDPNIKPTLDIKSLMFSICSNLRTFAKSNMSTKRIRKKDIKLRE